MEKVDISSPEWNDTQGRLQAIQLALVTLIRMSSPEIREAFKLAYPQNVQTYQSAGQQVQAGHLWKAALEDQSKRLLLSLD